MSALPHSDAVEPIDETRRRQVVSRTEHYLQLAEKILARPFERIPVLFDLRGRAAGMYRVRGNRREIRYNPYLFAKYFDDNLANTVPHEVAHYICDRVHGARNIRPHGAEWKMLMQAFGAVPAVTAAYDLDGIPRRRQRRYAYRCDCRSHELTSRRHNRIQRCEARYYCRSCGTVIRPAA